MGAKLLNIAFETEALRHLCLDYHVAVSHFGEELSLSFFAALADVRAAHSASDLFLGEFMDGTSDHPPMIRIGFGLTGIIDAVSNHPHHNTSVPERVDWSQVRRVRIVRVLSNDH